MKFEKNLNQKNKEKVLKYKVEKKDEINNEKKIKLEKIDKFRKLKTKSEH